MINYIESNFIRQSILAGKKVLVTAGPTEEPIDPVRVITKRSSGKMGYAIAERIAAEEAKAEAEKLKNKDNE